MTIQHKTTDRISIDAISIENQAEVARYLQIDPSTVLDRLGIDGRIISAPYMGDLPVPIDGIGFTEWGTPNTGDYGKSRINPLENASGISEVENYPYPDPANYDFARAAQWAESIGDKYAVRGPYWNPIFCRVCDLFGMEEAMLRMVFQPAIFEAVLEQAFVRVMEFCRNLIMACGDAMPIFCLGDDFATQKGLMISPEDWRKYLKPRYARIFDMAKSEGKLIWFHSCGDISSVLPDLIDIGIDVWETVQLHTLPISPEQLKRDFGKHITFFGGINTQRLPFASPDEIREEVRRCIQILGKDGGYICGPDHHIKPDVSAENTVALFDTALGLI